VLEPVVGLLRHRVWGASIRSPWGSMGPFRIKEEFTWGEWLNYYSFSNFPPKAVLDFIWALASLLPFPNLIGEDPQVDESLEADEEGDSFPFRPNKHHIRSNEGTGRAEIATDGRTQERRRRPADHQQHLRRFTSSNQASNSVSYMLCAVLASGLAGAASAASSRRRQLAGLP
jgi:hypothetical protein